MTQIDRTEVTETSPASDDELTEPEFGGVASFADAESREILNLLNQGDASGAAAGGCCGGGCCS